MAAVVLDESQVAKAVATLQQYHSVRKGKQKPQLVEHNLSVSLIIALKKIPDRTHLQPVCIPLPHSLHPAEETEICLFTKTDKATAKQQLQHRGVTCITKVIPLDKLKTNFKSFESRRKLSDSFDLFLTDRRIYHLLAPRLGKSFFQKKKFPISVDMSQKELDAIIQKARDSTYLHLGLGPCCAVPIGRIHFPTSDIVENVTQGMETMVTNIPRGWQNIQSVHLKTPDSIALPIFNSAPPEAHLLPPASLDNDTRKRKMVHLEPAEDLDQEPSKRVCEASGGNSPAPVQKKTPSSKKLSAKKIKGSRVLSSKYKRSTMKKL